MKRLVKNSFSLFLWLLRRVSLFRSPSVRVILGHDTPSESYAWWERLILELRRDFDFITPEEFTDYIEGNLKLKRNAILLTLDDGFHSNYDFCKNVLCRNNISALCFIIDDFIGLNESLSVEFIRKNIYPIATSIPAHWKPMNSRELNELLNLNHEFGYHTKSHMSMKHSTDYEFESNYLEKPKSPILKKNGMKFLAYPFGDMRNVSMDRIQILAKRYDYIFTGFCGWTKPASSIIPRDSVSHIDPIRTTLFKIYGGFDILYWFRRYKIKNGLRK